MTKAPLNPKRERILEAAMQLFAQLPYEHVQMDVVAQRAGVAKPTLYRYFAAKELLFLTALESFLGDYAKTMSELADSDLPATKALTQMARLAFDRFVGCTAILRATDGSEAGLGAKGRSMVRAKVEEIRQAIVRVLVRGADSADFEEVDPEVAALVILGALRMGAARMAPNRREAALDDMLSVLFAGIMRRPVPDQFRSEPLCELEDQ